MYPSVMAECEMPVGKPTQFEGELEGWETTEKVGFVLAHIKAPNNLNVPILQIRIKTKNGGYRTVAPLGKWEGVYYLKELQNALKYGYKIKILKGYLFEGKIIFKDYVNYFYNIKKRSWNWEK
jgi:hypothetical protein